MALLLLATLGVGIADFSPRAGFYFWLAAVPVFGILSFVTRRHQTGRVARTRDVVREELLHWLGTLAALYLVLVLVLVRTGRMNNEAAGLVGLLVLALSAYLAGVRGSLPMAAIGTVLGVATTVAAMLQQYLWVGFLPAVVGVLLAWSSWHFRPRPSGRKK